MAPFFLLFKQLTSSHYAKIITQLYKYVDSPTRRVSGRGFRIWFPHPRHRYAIASRKHETFCLTVYSFRTLLSFRARRRAYRIRKKTAHAHDLYSYWDPSHPLYCRPVPTLPLFTQRCVACGISGEHEAIPYCEAYRSVVPILVLYVLSLSQCEQLD